MEIQSINKDVKRVNNGLYDLFTTSFLYNPNIQLSEYVVSSNEEMRLDIVFANMYNIEYSILDTYLKDIDVILYINSIHNPLNIKKDMILKYPPNIEDLQNFRYVPDKVIDKTSVAKQLGVPNTPNKSTRKDSSRQSYIENDYSLSPVVLDTPREPVRIEKGNFSIGGL